MLLRQIVETSATVSGTSSRLAKVAALADCLRQAEPGEREVAVAYLGGTLPQRRTGLGWRGLVKLPASATAAQLGVLDVDARLGEIARLSGPGSQGARAAITAELFSLATAAEQEWLRGVITGTVRQGALDALVQEALAQAAGVRLLAVRRAAMLAGGTAEIAAEAFEGEAALAGVSLRVGRPVLPMLASSAPGVGEALAKVGGQEAAIDVKLDGIRIQVHRAGDAVVVATRSLDDITDRLPEVAEVVRSFAAFSFVLDGEAMLTDAAGKPRPFQETAARTASGGGAVVRPWFFDVLHVDGRDLLDARADVRLAELDALVPAPYRVARLITADESQAREFAARALADGHEGVIVKNLAAPYSAGRRGSSWVKVKPVHTLDLVVLAVEWGSGRRSGWLSNIHLGARDPRTGGFVMLGKTFKGMTDEMLAWQTVRFRQLETSSDGYVVRVRPEQVVEIAFDGLQRSRRYPGGVTLRFARVVRYRDDKSAQEADTIDAVLALGAS